MGQQKAHNIYLRYLDAQITVLRAAADDGESVFAEHPQIQQAHAQAAEALQNQAPNHALRQRAHSMIL